MMLFVMVCCTLNTGHIVEACGKKHLPPILGELSPFFSAILAAFRTGGMYHGLIAINF